MRVRLWIAVLSVSAASCAEGPSSPSSLSAITIQCPEFGESSRCSAVWMDGRSAMDVTGLASWSTGDPAIATVSSTGLVTAHSTGEVAIRASYQGATGFVAVWAIPGEGLHGTSRSLEGMVLSLNGPLSDVTMEILTGPNTGRRTVTSSTGRFSLNSLLDGPFTIRLSKPGYVTAEYLWRIPGGRERIPTLTQSR